MATTFVIFGASGDLASQKLLPALFRLHVSGRLPEETRVVGVSRKPLSDAQWRDQLEHSLRQQQEPNLNTEAWYQFGSHLFYQPGDLERPDDLVKLGHRLTLVEQGHPARRIYYLATLPSLYPTAVRHLGTSGLAQESDGPRRLVVEKPFGFDFQSARGLNEAIHQVFSERQVYRIDHYLGKETVQNLFVLRFANSVFEPIWNRNYVDHVQITVAEEHTLAARGTYYDAAGVLRDMVQNHLLQLLAIAAMEGPVRYEADLIRDEKVKVLQAIRRPTRDDVMHSTVRGQYSGYRSEPGVASDSQTATFAAIRVWIDNWRWQGVPFYLRSGKAMSCRTTQIVVQFRQPPLLLFADQGSKHLDANRLVIQIQPAEGIQLHLLTKVPDSHMRLRMTDLDFRFTRQFADQMPDAYQRLLLDVAAGDGSLFLRADEAELAWQLVDPILDVWETEGTPRLEIYRPGQWGPGASADWMRAQGREWFDVCPVLA